MHVLHQGRAEYTLITPGNPPNVERKVRDCRHICNFGTRKLMVLQVMGPNIHAGEVLQLIVPTGVWKMSCLLAEDRAAASSKEDEKERYGCLITEVVFPGFAWEDHCFLTREEFDGLWDGSDVPEAKELLKRRLTDDELLSNTFVGAFIHSD